MKCFLALVVLIAGASAIPQEAVQIHQERIISGPIISAIEDLSQLLRDIGLDPLNIKRETIGYALPVPVLFNAQAFVEDLLSTGLSNIIINHMNFGLLTSRLDFDIELPRIHASIGDAFGEVTIFGSKIQAAGSGSVDIQSIRVVGRVRVSIGIISGINISSVDMNFTLGGIDSNTRVVIQDRDISDFLNQFLGATIPDTLREFKAEVDELIEIVMLQILQDLI